MEQPNFVEQKEQIRAQEAGIALVIASALISLLLLLPVVRVRQQNTPLSVTVASTTIADTYSHISIEATAAVVYDLATGQTLYEKNADAQLPLASLTKLLTVYAALGDLSPNSTVTISARATAVTPPHRFEPGDSFRLEDLSRLTLTASLNDGAAAIAEATAQAQHKSEQEVLAAAAAGLHLSQTYAVNGSGLDVNKIVSGGYGSARDLARLAGAVVETAPNIASATTQSSTDAVSIAGKVFSVKNTDPMISALPHPLLSKTGYTDIAGGNLALVFDVGIRHPIAVVILGSTQTARFTDGAALVAATLAHFAGVSSL